MQCLGPIKGWYKKEGGFTTSLKLAHVDRPLTIRCGQCMGCRIERTRQWAIRIHHESSLYENNIFATLTYDDENLPYKNNLVRRDFQLFMKRLRKKHPKARMFYSGEYGDETLRPHFHPILFNYEPSDKELLYAEGQNEHYESETLTSLWGKGHATFSDVTFDSASYVAGYITKKFTGPNAAEHYTTVDDETGEIFTRNAPFSGQSLKPAIGRRWIEKWYRQVYPRDEIIINGRAMRPPKYYDDVLKEIDPTLHRQLLNRRKSQAHTEIASYETPEGFKRIGAIDVDFNEYKNSSRHMYALEKITKSKLKLRKEQ